MPLNGPYLTAQRFLGMGKETTRGTPVSPSIYIPVSPVPSLKPQVVWLPDKGLRASPVDLYNYQAGVQHDTYDIKGNTFLDSFPNLLLAAMGGPDTVTGTTAPYTHSIPLLNSWQAGSQPPSYTTIDVDLIEESSGTYNAKQITDSQLKSLELTFNVTGALEWTAQYLTQAFTEVARPASPSWSSEIFVPAWNGAVTFGGTQSFVVMEGSIMIDRQTEPIFTLGSQSPYRLYAGPIKVTGKLKFVALENDPTMALGTATNHETLIIVFTETVSSHTLTLQMSQVQFMDPTVTGDKIWVTVETNFEAEADTTDAVTGYSPLTTSVTNAQSSAY